MSLPNRTLYGEVIRERVRGTERRRKVGSFWTFYLSPIPFDTEAALLEVDDYSTNPDIATVYGLELRDYPSETVAKAALVTRAELIRSLLSR